jgi:hypothetical protein
MATVRTPAAVTEPDRPTRSDDTTVLRDGSKATRESIEALVAEDLARRAAERG